MTHLNKKNGHVLIFAAFFIPILIILSGLIIDGGILFVRKAQLQLIVDNAASAGISILTDEMLEIIDQKTTLYPDINTQKNPLSMIDDNDRITLSQSTKPRSLTETYIHNNNTQRLEFTDYVITYPYNYTSGDSTISLKVEIATEHSFYFTSVIGINSQAITAEAISSIRIK